MPSAPCTTLSGSQVKLRHSTVVVPPAASIFSLAEPENALRAHLDGDGDVALAEDLDRVAVADGALGDEVVDGDGATLGEEVVDAGRG